MEECLKPVESADGAVTCERMEKTLALVSEVRDRLQCLEQTLARSPEVVIDRKTERTRSLRERLDRANQQIEALTGKRHCEEVCYDYVPSGRMDRAEFVSKLQAMRFAASTGVGVLMDRQSRAVSKEMTDLDLRFKTQELLFLQSTRPIDLASFHARLHPLLDEKRSALQGLRELELEGTDTGEV